VAGGPATGEAVTGQAAGALPTAERASTGLEPAEPEPSGPESTEPESTEPDSTEPAPAEPPAAQKQPAWPDGISVRIPRLGTISLPPREDLAFVGGIAAIAILGAIEWPIAAVLCVGHLLATNGRHKSLREFGEALDRG
jgi:hypothetical protein